MVKVVLKCDNNHCNVKHINIYLINTKIKLLKMSMDNTKNTNVILF